MYDNGNLSDIMNAQVQAPAGAHSEGHRANGNRFTNVAFDGWHWVRKKLNGPGAMNYAFVDLQLAESTAIGAGVRQRTFWQTVATPLFVSNQSRPTSGYGGIVQGQTISQPLFDPYANQYGNIQGGN